MDIVGIICEYNPFHNGHIYHLNKVKELFPNSIIILIMSSSFTQRGIPSIINKWDKTEIALKYGVDLFVELPFHFASQSADFFADASIKLLTHLKCNYLVFGSESNNIDTLLSLANSTINNNEYDKQVKKYLDLGNNYPTSLNLALKDLTGNDIISPNDLLGFSYVKAIINQKSNIKPITIKRTNDYNNTTLSINNISSASSIRLAFQTNSKWKQHVPIETIQKMENSKFLIENYFPFIKYKILTCDDLSIYQTVDEGIGNRLKKVIVNVESVEELIKQVKTKRYTYNKISRMLIHILCEFTKEKAQMFKEIEYIRILGFSNNGKNYLNKIKKDSSIPIITTYSKGNSKMLKYEKTITSVYASVLDEKNKNDLIKQEYMNKPKMMR